MPNPTRPIINRPGALGDVFCLLTLAPRYAQHFGESPRIMVHPRTYDVLGDFARTFQSELGGVELIRSDWPVGTTQSLFNLIGYPFQEGVPAPLTKHLTCYFAEELGIPLDRDQPGGLEQLPAIHLPDPGWADQHPFFTEASWGREVPYVTVHVQALWSRWKNWPVEKWNQLVDALHRVGLLVVQIGGPDDPQLPKVDASLLGHPFMDNLKAQAHAACHIGPDSLLAHTTAIRWAHRGDSPTPAILLFGSTSPVGFGYPHAVNLFRGLSCQPCQPGENPECHNPNRGACLSCYEPEHIIQCLRGYLPGLISDADQPPPLPGEPRISVTMICKNEASCILTALESVREADEIVVCDTGSSDDTVRLVTALGWDNLKLTYHKWDDHFADARNACLRSATGDWCLILDADETVSEGTIPALREAIKQNPEARTLRFSCHAAGNHDIRHFMIRAHRRHPSVKWLGRVHEAINCDDQITAPGCHLYYGYSPAHDLDPDRVFRLLWKDVADSRIRHEEPGTRTLYYLAREYWYRQQWGEAEKFFRERVKQIGNRGECADAWLYIARCCIHLGRPDDARSACANAIILNANFREALLLMADLSFPDNALRWRQFAQLADNREVLFIR